MNTGILERHFERLGARVRVGLWVPARVAARPRLDGLAVDVKSDHEGEYFDIQVDSVLIDLDVVEVQPQERYLLMQARHLAAGRQEKFICGHDERAWFVAAVPAERGASNVPAATLADPGAPGPVAPRVSSVRTAVEAVRPAIERI